MSMFEYSRLINTVVKSSRLAGPMNLSVPLPLDCAVMLVSPVMKLNCSILSI